MTKFRGPVLRYNELPFPPSRWETPSSVFHPPMFPRRTLTPLLARTIPLFVETPPSSALAVFLCFPWCVFSPPPPFLFTRFFFFATLFFSFSVRRELNWDFHRRPFVRAAPTPPFPGFFIILQIAGLFVEDFSPLCPPLLVLPPSLDAPPSFYQDPQSSFSGDLPSFAFVSTFLEVKVPSFFLNPSFPC